MFRIKVLIFNGKKFSTSAKESTLKSHVFEKDSFSNVTPQILDYLNKNLHKKNFHPICFTKERIINFFNKKFKNRRGNPIFSVHDDLNPIVSTKQNFDSLLIPPNHPSRRKTDCYYFNENWMLRAHMTAHQSELIKSGLNNFLMVGDVYRKDTVDSTHFPVFHQMDGVRLFTPEELFVECDDGRVNLEIQESGTRTEEKQGEYTLKASQMVEADLRQTFEDLAKEMFGNEVTFRWVKAFFPFTHPSWELELKFNDKWTEILGCGVIEHKILENAGCQNRIGWAFGAGLERLAMHYYSIPDIRIFWSTSKDFHDQFENLTCYDVLEYNPFSSSYNFHISFWIPKNFKSQDFYDLIKELFDDKVVEVKEFEPYKPPDSTKESRTFKIKYKGNETIDRKEALEMHKILGEKAVLKLHVKLR